MRTQAFSLLLIAASCTGVVKPGPPIGDGGSPTSNPDASAVDAGVQQPTDAGTKRGSDAGGSTADAGTPTDGGVPLTGAPAILYTDIVSGPKTGGENNDGIYLSLFGVNFGVNPATVSVTIGGGAVARILYLGPSNGRPDIQQLSVQLGPNAQTGAIVVTVQGVASNADQTFTLSAGNIYFIDNLNGSDGNTGTFAAPLQTLTAATAKVAPGDFMVMKSNPSAPYTTASTYVWGVRTSGGSATSAITLMGYPGQFPYVDAGNVTKAGIYAYDGNLNNYINIVGIKLEAAGTEGAVDVESGGSSWRVVNDDLSMRSAGANGLPCNAGGIAGNGQAEYWVGNHIHDTNGTSQDQTHGIYVNNGPGTYEIAFNWIEVINNGTGIQLDGPQGPSASPATTGAHVHHNIVHDTLKYGVEIGNYSNTSGYMPDIVVWDNLVYNTRGAGLIFNTITSLAPLHALIYDNTLYDVATAGVEGAIDNDNGSTLGATGMSIAITNNILVPHAGSAYYSELSSSSGLAAVPGSNNLWSGGSGPTLGANPVMASPAFASPPAATVSSGQPLPDMTLSAGSGGIGAGSTAVLTGNGVSAMTYFPAFVGVTNDLNGKPMPASIDVGATQ